MKSIFGRAAPIRVQVVLLVFVSILLAQAANFTVISILPPPARAQYQPTEVARLLSGSDRSGDFSLLIRTEPPTDDYVDPDERAFTTAVATELKVPSERVRAIFMTGPPPPPHSDAPPGPPPEERNPFGAGTERMTFIAARQLAGGRWLWLEERPGWLDEWQKRTLVWLLLSALLIAPLAFLFANRFIGPVRAFAASAERIGHNPQAEAMEVRGPAEIEEAAHAFRRMQLRIRRFVEDRTQMVAAIAHDLRTPLTRLAFRLEKLPDDQREAAMADIDEMRRMIGAALDYAKGETKVEQFEHLDLSELLKKTAGSLVHEQGDIRLKVDEPIFIKGDAAALQRLISNLLLNALRYGRRTVARVETKGGHALLHVNDQGPGLPADELERVFEPFYRVEASRNRQSGGIGLGLPIARSIAMAHGGDIALTNTGEGLRATLSLPLATSS